MTKTNKMTKTMTKTRTKAMKIQGNAIKGQIWITAFGSDQMIYCNHSFREEKKQEEKKRPLCNCWVDALKL